MAGLGRWLMPKPLAIGAGLALIILLALIDFGSGAEVSFALFYFLPIFICAWVAGRGAGIFIALAAGAACFLTDEVLEGNFSHPWVPYFNLISRTGAFLIVALLIAAMRDFAETLEERVARRTEQLRAEIAERQKAETALGISEERFRMFMDNSPMVVFVKDDAGRYIYVNPAFQKRFDFPVVGKTAADLFPAELAERLRQGDLSVLEAGKPIEFTDAITFPDGSMGYWLNLRFPLKDTAGKMFIGGVSLDVTESRNLERQLLEISDREQARIGQDLHDGLCQVLVSAAFDCNSLQQRLVSVSKTEADAAAQLGNVIDDAITQARQVARGLYPVKLELDGLVSALNELALSVQARSGVACNLDCPKPVPLTDNVVATHLYRIAQEAVNNALRHSGSKRISIRLTESDNSVELSVRDDGIGLGNRAATKGMGLHIMDYRARSMGGRLTAKPGEPAGTIVSCVVPFKTS